MAPFLAPLNKNRLAGLRFRTRAEGPFLGSRTAPFFAQNVPQICFASVCWLAGGVGTVGLQWRGPLAMRFCKPLSRTRIQSQAPTITSQPTHPKQDSSTSRQDSGTSRQNKRTSRQDKRTSRHNHQKGDRTSKEDSRTTRQDSKDQQTGQQDHQRRQQDQQTDLKPGALRMSFQSL